MDINEYNTVKDFTYDEYCKYLQNKYGVPSGNYYLTETCKSKNSKIKRTSEGLFIHHIREDTAAMLCHTEAAILNPFEYQLAKNLCYCDYLEHLFLHILICESDAPENLGSGGIFNYISPELNDIYSGWIPVREWQQKCVFRVINDKDVYLCMLQDFKNYVMTYIDDMQLTCMLIGLNNDGFCRSANSAYGWDANTLNKPLYEEIQKL